MPTFYFQLLDHEGVRPTEIAYTFDSAGAAIEDARRALSEMAADGLPTGAYDMLSVEVFDELRNPIREIRLVLEEVDKTVPDAPSLRNSEARPALAQQKEHHMSTNSPKPGAPGTTDQWPRWEGPQENTPRGYMPAKDNPDTARDANGESESDPEKKKVSDALKQRGDG